MTKVHLCLYDNTEKVCDCVIFYSCIESLKKLIKL